MKTRLKKGLKRRLRRLAEKHGVDGALAMVTAYLGGLGDSKADDDDAAPQEAAEDTPIRVAAAEPTPIYPPYPPPEPGHSQPEQHH